MYSSAERYQLDANTWETLPAPPQDLGYNGCAAAHSGRVYYFGGQTDQTQALSFDPSTNTWATHTNLPNGRFYHQCVVIGDHIYVVGDEPRSATTLKYTPSTDSWTTPASMGTSRHSPAAAALGGKLYVFGGHGTSPLSSAEKYDPDTDTWTAIASMPTHNYYGKAAASGSFIYITGGVICSGCNNGGTQTVLKYDPTADTYTSVASMNGPRELHATGTSPDGRVWVYGGVEDGSAIGQRSIEVYDPAANTWTALSGTMNLPRGYTTGVVL